MKGFIISLGSHTATDPSIVTAIGKLMQSVVNRGTTQEHETLAKAMHEILTLSGKLDARFDILDGEVLEKN